MDDGNAVANEQSTATRRVKAKLRDDRTEATRAHETRAMDFVHDQLATGTKLRILATVDLYSRFSPVIDPRLSYRGEDVVATLERVCSEIGYPRSIRVDQGSEFVSRDLDLWAYQHDVTLDFSRPGKPTDNAFIEAFNGRLRAECLNTHWFLKRALGSRSGPVTSAFKPALPTLLQPGAGARRPHRTITTTKVTTAPRCEDLFAPLYAPLG